MRVDTRIQWSQDEWSRFLLAARFFGPPRRGDTEQVYKAAQLRAQVRPRPFDPATAARMNKARSTPLSDGSVAKVPEPVPIPPPVVEVKEEPIAAPVPAPAGEEVVIKVPEKSPVAEMILDTLREVLYDPSLRKALRDLVAEALAPEAELEQRQAITWREPKTPAERKPRVVIAGGGPNLWTAMDGYSRVDLRYWTGAQGESVHRLKAILAHADACVVMTRFIGHDAMNGILARSRTNGLHLIRCNGTLDSIKSELDRLNPGRAE